MALLTNMGAKTTLVLLALVLIPVFTSGEGCGEHCGYGTECTENKCVCKPGYSGSFTITSDKAILYCVRDCQPNASSCPVYTTCREQITGDGKFRCYCSADAELADSGQCQGKRQTILAAIPGSTKSPATSVTWKSTSTPSGEGCGEECGYGTECIEMGCDCKPGYSGKFTLPSNPSLLYCVRECQPNASSCPVNTTCRQQITGDGKFRCYCSVDAELSDSGQCQGKGLTLRTAKPGSTKSPATSLTWKSTSTRSTVRSTGLSTTEMSTVTEISTRGRRIEESTCDKSGTLTTGLAVGMGVAILVAFMLAVVLVWRIRFLKIREKCECHSPVSQTERSNGTAPSTVEIGPSYENVMSSSLPGESVGGSLAAHGVETEAEVQRTDVPLWPSVDVPDHNGPNTYVNMPAQSPDNNETRGLYESANTPDRSETRLYTTMWKGTD